MMQGNRKIAAAEKDYLFNQSSQAASPAEDYINLKVNSDQVMITTWKIDSPCLHDDENWPIAHNISLEDFLDDFDLQNDLRTVFEEETLEKIVKICKSELEGSTRI